MIGQLDMFDLLDVQESGLLPLTFYYSWGDLHCSICGTEKRSGDMAVAGQVCLDWIAGLADVRSTAWVSCKICKDCDKKYPDELDGIQAQLADGSRPHVMGDRKSVAPLSFTTREFHPDEFDAAANAYRSWVDGEFKMYQGWRESQTGRNGLGSAHPSFTYSADVRCSCNDKRMSYDRVTCSCVRGLYYRSYCAGCDWWTPVAHGENEATELLLDHCWPGWRDLPTVESKPNAKFEYDFAFPKDYPPEWQVSGAPVKECRGSTTVGTRHVPGGSPWGGYRTAVMRECKQHRK